MNLVPFLRRNKNRNAARAGRFHILGGSVALLAAVLLPLQKAEAVTYYWDTASGTWQTATNWTTDSTGSTVVGSAVPGAADTVFFNGSALNGIEIISLNVATAALGLNFTSSSSAPSAAPPATRTGATPSAT